MKKMISILSMAATLVTVSTLCAPVGFFGIKPEKVIAIGTKVYNESPPFVKEAVDCYMTIPKITSTNVDKFFNEHFSISEEAKKDNGSRNFETPRSATSIVSSSC